jgi:ABC-type dipeptide/oligopeptide/nickel transport system permease subunit
MTVETLGPVAPAEERVSGRSGVLRRLACDKVAVLAALVLALIALCAVFAPVVAPYDPYFTDLAKAMQPPSAEHWFGTDNIGRDILSRVIYGTRNTLMLGLIGFYYRNSIQAIKAPFNPFVRRGWRRSRTFSGAPGPS